MIQPSSGKVPVSTLERLANYLPLLIDMEKRRAKTISSTEVEKHTGISAAQFRKDLSYFGDFGKPGVGYSVAELKSRISNILHIDAKQDVLLVGAGNLGTALAGSPGLKALKFRLIAVFDNNQTKIGTPVLGHTVRCMSDISKFCKRSKVKIAILAVPSTSAQQVTDTLIEVGVRAILNFAPLPLKVPDGIVVRNVSFLTQLAVLSYDLKFGESTAESQ